MTAGMLGSHEKDFTHKNLGDACASPICLSSETDF
jgi:hypothetical protein